MATLQQYFDMDFPHTAKFHVSFIIDEIKVEAHVHYDFSGYFSFFSCYIKEANLNLDFFVKLVRSLDYGNTKFKFEERIGLPSVKQFPGSLLIRNDNPPCIEAIFFGETTAISTNDIQASRRVFLYSETQLSDTDLEILKTEGKKLGHELQFRSQNHLQQRSKWEKPLAFISHDYRDKEKVAKPIALYLQGRLCPVWYDEFSLKVGEPLRESIEKGLKECKKCVLILSNFFFSNGGWTKVEFNSIFTREILEKKRLVLPVWYNISKDDVYNYSPSLLNVKGLDWIKLGEEEVCRQLHQAITA